jgi:hypothetical protein
MGARRDQLPVITTSEAIAAFSDDPLKGQTEFP